jgi:DNA-binding response OmpR family regulator
MLLDLQMPIMDGIAVLAGVKERIAFSALPIVVLSSIEDPEMIYKVLKLGAKDFWVKPLTMAERIDMVRVLYARWLIRASTRVADRPGINSWSLRLAEQPAPAMKKHS